MLQLNLIINQKQWISLACPRTIETTNVPLNQI